MGPEPAEIHAGVEQPTRVRWQILGLLMAYVALCHFNRISMSVAGTERILEDYHEQITPTEMGLVYTSYLLVYTLLMTPGGWLIDRLGPRLALVLMGFGSALGVALTGLTGLAISSAPLLLLGLIVVRGGTGAVTAPIHPAGARIVSRWVAVGDRARFNGLVTASACIGMASTFFVFGSLMDQSSWQWAFVLTGTVTGLLAIAWTWCVTDFPAQHPCVNPAERELIEGRSSAAIMAHLTGVTARPHPHVEKESLSALLRNRSLILLTVSYGLLGYIEYLFFYWMEYYFEKVLHLDKETGRLASTICTLTMGAGMFAGGWLADRLQARWGRRRGRKLVPAGGMALGAGLLLLGLAFSDPIWIVLCSALALAAVGASEGPFWTMAVELGGARGGTAAGILNTGGNAVGLLAPVLTPLIGASFGWHWAIAPGILAGVVGAVLWAWIVPEDGQRQRH